jgi:predicted nucleic acid-binding protein
MRLVIDASVAIAAMRPAEPDHVAARARVERALRGHDELVEPAIFGVEVAGALARRGTREQDIRDLVLALTRPPHKVVTIGPKSATPPKRARSKLGYVAPTRSTFGSRRREGLRSARSITR